MPIPWLPLLIIGGSSFVALKKISDGRAASDQAETLIHEAQATVSNVEAAFGRTRADTEAALVHLGEVRHRVWKDQFARFGTAIRPLKRYLPKVFERLDGVSPDFDVEIPALPGVEELTISGEEAAKGGAAAIAVGGVSAGVAFGLTGAFGLASTGTPIATLSGAAAKSATLANLGGGSLVKGGLGIAGGRIVQLLTFAAPLAATAAWAWNSKMQGDLATAKKAHAEAETYREVIENKIAALQGISDVSDRCAGELERLSVLFSKHLDQLERLVGFCGGDYTRLSEKQRRFIDQAVRIAQVVKRYIDTPLLDDQGKLLPTWQQMLAASATIEK